VATATQQPAGRLASLLPGPGAKRCTQPPTPRPWRHRSDASAADLPCRGQPFEQILNARTADSKHPGHRLEDMFGAVLFTIGACVVVAIARATLRFERNHSRRR
jgi:hypothetical protein